MTVPTDRRGTVAGAWALSLAILSVFSSATAHAALVDRGNGYIYDTDLGITWLADADQGPMDWFGALAWAAAYDVDGLRDWRLPTSQEMAHLFFAELSGNESVPIRFSADPDLNLFGEIARPGEFTDFYWSSAEYLSDLNFAIAFGFNNGNDSGRTYPRYKWTTYGHAWGVHDGDVGALVPEPATAVLLGGAIALLAVWKRP